MNDLWAVLLIDGGRQLLASIIGETGNYNRCLDNLLVVNMVDSDRGEA